MNRNDCLFLNIDSVGSGKWILLEPDKHAGKHIQSSSIYPLIVRSQVKTPYIRFLMVCIDGIHTVNITIDLDTGTLSLLRTASEPFLS